MHSRKPLSDSPNKEAGINRTALGEQTRIRKIHIAILIRATVGIAVRRTNPDNLHTRQLAIPEKTSQKAASPGVPNFTG